jgi:hypothetical protein
MNVTVTVCGLFVATLDKTGTVAVNVPAGRLARAAVRVNAAGAIVALRVALSHPAGCPIPYVIAPTARPLSVPPPPLNTLSVWAAGFAPPSAPKNMRLGCRRLMNGNAVTVNVTDTACGLFVAPLPVTYTVAVYVPAARLPVVAVSVNAAGAVVALKLALSHPIGCPLP